MTMKKKTRKKLKKRPTKSMFAVKRAVKELNMRQKRTEIVNYCDSSRNQGSDTPHKCRHEAEGSSRSFLGYSSRIAGCSIDLGRSLWR